MSVHVLSIPAQLKLHTYALGLGFIKMNSNTSKHQPWVKEKKLSSFFNYFFQILRPNVARMYTFCRSAVC